jgi:hypothetical protein
VRRDELLKLDAVQRVGAAIIITDVHLALEKTDYAKRMYIALTRALATVCMIDSRDVLLRDPILRLLWEHC